MRNLRIRPGSPLSRFENQEVGKTAFASRFQIGLVIFTGLGIGTLFTLFVVPAFYMLLAKDRRGEQGLFDGDLPPETDQPSAASAEPSPAE